MNREIKFRGKAKKDGRWLLGFLSKDARGQFRIQFDVKCFSAAVIPETVGQFTGLIDKNGKEIYEGDILLVCNGSINCCPWMDKPYPVEYQINKGFIMPMFLWDKDGSDLSNSTHYCEAIGNIHDNSDLLK